MNVGKGDGWSIVKQRGQVHVKSALPSLRGESGTSLNQWCQILISNNSVANCYTVLRNSMCIFTMLSEMTIAKCKCNHCTLLRLQKVSLFCRPLQQ